MKRAFPVILLLLATSACKFHAGAESPVMTNGVKSGNSKINFTTEGGERDIHSNVMLDTGENFKGTVQQKVEYESPDLLDHMATEMLNEIRDNRTSLNNTTYDGYATSQLIEVTSGKKMACKFTLSDPQQMIFGGGVGECVIEDGRKIPVTF